MRRLLVLLALLLSLTIPRAGRADPGDIGAAARGVVRVVLVAFDGRDARLIGHGSGFAVGPRQIVTNAHVVEAATGNGEILIGIVPPEGKKGFLAKVTAISPDNDLALLTLAEPGSIPTLALYPGAVGDGSEVFAAGYPGNVDMAEGLNLADLVEPQAPVKSRGFVSGGRSARSVDTLLHTAAIGAGNSGGPLLDNCGRVVGVNSFGTVSDNGTDSAFYFAISMRELVPFLQKAGVQAHLNATPCRSNAEFQASESQRAAAESERLAAKGALDRERAEQRRRDTVYALIAERENLMGLAGLLLAAALAFAGWTAIYADERRAKSFFALSGALAFGAVLAWLLRPPFSAIEDRVKAAEAPATGTPAATGAAPATTAAAKGEQASAGTGKMICVFDPQRSRVTVSDTTDVPLDFEPGGCVNGRTQYGLASDPKAGWSRVLVPRQDETVSVNAYDPATRVFRTDHYLLGLDAIAKLRDARGKFTAATCGANESAARQLATDEAALRALLPPEPQERLTYHCQPAK